MIKKICKVICRKLVRRMTSISLEMFNYVDPKPYSNNF